MKQGWLLFVAMCAFTAAMVPKDKREVEENGAVEQPATNTNSSSTNSTAAAPKAICAPQTPCAWSMYKPKYKIIEYHITNNYCDCDAETVCKRNEDDASVNAYVYRCRPASEPSLLEES